MRLVDHYEGASEKGQIAHDLVLCFPIREHDTSGAYGAARPCKACDAGDLAIDLGVIDVRGFSPVTKLHCIVAIWDAEAAEQRCSCGSGTSRLDRLCADRESPVM